MVKRAWRDRDHDDSRLRGLLQETMGRVDAPAGFEERVAARVCHASVRDGRVSVRRPITVRAVVACGLIAAVMASGAYALVETDFFGVAFGSKGNPDVAAHPAREVLSDCVKTWTMPERTWEEADADAAQRLLGAYVEDINQSVSMRGYTLTIEQGVIDEHGNGVATFSLENPAGVELQGGEYGEVALANEAPTSVVMQELDARGDVYAFWDSRMVRDADASTDTVLHGALYFGPFTGEIGKGVSWLMPDRTITQRPGQSLVDVSAVLDWCPANPVPATTLRTESGDAVDLSPLALVVYEPAEADELWGPFEVTVRYVDGSEYVVVREGMEDPVNNRVVGYKYMDGSASAHVFNRLVDVDAVASVEVANQEGHRWVYER